MTLTAIETTKSTQDLSFITDTIKTRLQSQHGFIASGGFRGIYSGLLTAVIGSAPGGKGRKKEKKIAHAHVPRTKFDTFKLN